MRLPRCVCDNQPVTAPTHSCAVLLPVLEDHQNPRLIRDLLQDLSSALGALLRGVGKSVLVGSIGVWACRLEMVLAWQRQLQDLQMTQVRTLHGGRDGLQGKLPSSAGESCLYPPVVLYRLLFPGGSGPKTLQRSSSWKELTPGDEAVNVFTFRGH